MDFDNFTTTTILTTLTTTAADNNSTLPSWTGFVFLLCSGFLYGSNYLPVKSYDTGDGQFFQLLVCIGIWLVGFVLNIVRGFPKFYMLPMLGGALWATGNNMVVPIIQTVGIGLGMIFWNCIGWLLFVSYTLTWSFFLYSCFLISGLVTGWATARFGCKWKYLYFYRVVFIDISQKERELCACYCCF